MAGAATMSVPLSGQIWPCIKEDLARDTSGHQRDAYQRSEGLLRHETKYAAHNLKKKTGKQHITGYARATQIIGRHLPKSLQWSSERVFMLIIPFAVGRSHPSLFVIYTWSARTTVMNVTRTRPWRGS
jgi:hypothetical protein